MENLFTTTKMVREVLEVMPQARNSDNFLYFVVCNRIATMKGIDVNKMSMPMFLLNLKEFGFPNFETVRRTRQKLQAENAELRACETVEAMRDINEELYRYYARQMNV